MSYRWLNIALSAFIAVGTMLPGTLLPLVAHASAPNTISYQGRLRDADGVVVEDGDYDFTFTLWTDPDAGAADWTEDQTLTVTDGYFSAQLGSVDPFQDGALEETTFSVPLFLEVTVEAETLDPRVSINSVAYALSTRSVESYANAGAAEAASEPYGGRMYYNTTDGHLYVYDDVGDSWEDTTAAGGGGDVNDAYDGFGADPAVVTIDGAEGQGNLTLFVDGADVDFQNDGGVFATFADSGAISFLNGSTLAVNGAATLGDNGDTVAINSSDWDISTTGDMTGIGAITADGSVAFSGGVTSSAGEVLVSAGNMQLNDNVVLALGTGNDFEIVHDGANTSLTNITGALQILNVAGNVSIDSVDWDISTTGAMSGIASLTTDDNQSTLPFNISVSGADVAVHTISLQMDGSPGITLSATGDGAGGVGAKTIGIGTTPTADTVNIGDADADVSVTDANWSINNTGNATFEGNITLSAGGGSILSTGGGLTFGDGTSTATINTNDWDIGTNGSMSGIESISSDDNQSVIAIAIPVTGVDVATHTIHFGIDANSALSIAATGDGAGGVGARTVLIGQSAAADIIGIGDADADVSITDANWSISASGDFTTGGGDIIGASGTSIDMGEQIAGAININAGASNVIVNDDSDTALLFNSGSDGTDTDITTTGGQDLRISPGGVGDIILVTDADSQLTLTGSADGTDSLVLTNGDIAIANGDLDVQGGDFNVTLDSADSVNIQNTTATTNTPALNVNLTSDVTNTGNVNGLIVNTVFADYADDGAADNRHGINVTVTNNASDAGIDDTLYGVRIQNLVGSNQADGSEFALATGLGWDTDWNMGNNETVSNQSNGIIRFGSAGGSGTNASLSMDLDGTSDVPTIIGSTQDLVAVFDSLTVGIDGATTENIADSGFTISGGDDLYVNDDAGFNGDVYVDGLFAFSPAEGSLTGATPSVAGGNYFRLAQGGGTIVTNFTNGQTGQILFMRLGDSNSTFDCDGSSGGQFNCGTTDVVSGGGDLATWFLDAPGKWELVSYMDASDNQNAGNGFDYAEWFPSRAELSPGTVVSVDPTASEYVTASSGAYDPAVVGVVSTQPGMTIGEPANAFAAQIALAGRVPVNVTNENGPIVPGDYLVASSTPGYAMRATEAGAVIAIAMDSFDGSAGQVGSKIANFWYAPSASGASSLQGSDGSALAAGALDADTLVVAGSALFEGSVTVSEHLYGGSDVAGRARIVSGDDRVHVSFETPYASQPIVTATLRTSTDIPGYWWVEEESTTGFDILLDGTLDEDVEFNWIALGVNDGHVSVSDGSTRDIQVYVNGNAPAEILGPPAGEETSSEQPTEEPDISVPTEDVVGLPAEEAIVEEVASEEPPAEPAPEEVPSEETSEPLVE